MVVVVNNSVFKVDSSLRKTFIGDISTSSGFVSIAENLNNQIAIVDGLNCYIYNYSLSSLTKQKFTTNLIPNYVVYHNTYFVFGNADLSSNGSAWYVYSYDTPTKIKEAVQLALQTKSDYAIAVSKMPGGGNNILVFGTSVTEIWTNIPNYQNIYQRMSSANIDYGCLSVATIATSDKYVMWLGINEDSSPVILMFFGNTVIPVSTDGINYQLGSLKNPEKSLGFFFKNDGHLFYIITFYSNDDNLTIVYDIETKQFFNLTDAESNSYPANKIVYFNNNIYFTSFKNGCLYQAGTNFTTYDENLDSDVYSENLNKEIPRIRITSSQRMPNSQPFASKNISINMASGNDINYSLLNLKSIQLNEYEKIPYVPRVNINISKDGGVTFGNTVSLKTRTLGNRKNIIRYPGQLGWSNDITFKFSFLSKNNICVLNATFITY